MKQLLLLACASFACSGPAVAQETTRCTLVAAGLDRSCYVHVPYDLPPGKPVPLVFIFHGSGGNGAGMESFSEFSALANREGFIAVYPDALALNWNDGRNASSIPSQAQHVDDVAFVAAMIRELEGRRPSIPSASSLPASRMAAFSCTTSPTSSHRGLPPSPMWVAALRSRWRRRSIQIRPCRC